VALPEFSDFQIFQAIQIDRQVEHGSHFIDRSLRQIQKMSKVFFGLSSRSLRDVIYHRLCSPLDRITKSEPSTRSFLDRLHLKSLVFPAKSSGFEFLCITHSKLKW